MAGGTSSRRLKPIVLYTLFTICVVAPTAKSQEAVCETEVCKAVAEAYESSLNESGDPCSDFFTHVCSGWMQKLAKKYPSHPEYETGTGPRLEEVSTLILARELERIIRLPENETDYVRHDSDLQPAKFYQSCLLSVKKADWDLNLKTLRDLFREVGLPFFDEAMPVEIIDGEKPTPLSSLLRLALQFDINPIFAITFPEGDLVQVDKTGRKHEEVVPNITPGYFADLWKTRLLDVSRHDHFDPKILNVHASLFGSFGIYLNKSTLLRIGRNYEAVMNAFDQYIGQRKNISVDVKFENTSEILNRTYLDLFGKHTGNLARLRGQYRLRMTTSFFKPIMIVTTDPDLAQLFYDYITLFILHEEFRVLLNRNTCGVDGIRAACNTDLYDDRSVLCATMVSVPSSIPRQDSAY